ncbi:MAG TPA: PspC domain-containing protein, partial [Microlunatus sp.]|nr:PspC domain-containing protein [Microlunatus sp.]
VITLFTGIPIVLYLIALFVMPEESATPPQPPYVNGPQPGAYDAGYSGQYAAQQPYGAPAQPPVDQVWGPGGAPWEQPQTAPPAASAATPTPQAWSQPSAPEPTVVEPTPLEPTTTEPTTTEPTTTEPTGYDTAPATPEQAPTDPESDRKV